MVVIMRKYMKGMIVYGSDAYLFQRKPTEVVIVSSEDELKEVSNSLITDKKNFCLRAAGTGYAGACIPINEDEVVIKLSGFKRILHLDTNERHIDVEAGVTPFEINKYVNDYGLFYPPDPASHKVCTIGGNIAMNAGGPHCYMYGVTSNYVQRIKCFIPKYGEYIEIGADSPYSLIYDLKDLFIGSEGLLGIITKARLRLNLNPPCIYTYLISFNNYLDAVNFIYDSISNGLTFAALDMSIDPYIPGINDISNIGAHLLISIHGGDRYITYAKDMLKKLTRKYDCEYQQSEGEELMAVRSALVRQNVRKVINLSKKPQYFLFDAVVPRSKLGNILSYSYILADKLEMPLMNTFHAGDGNIHPTLFYNPYSQDDLKKLKIFWYAILKRVLNLNGSITGEHGIGIEKRDLFTYYEDKITLKITEAIKSFFDPNFLLNNGRVFVKKDNALEKEIIKLDNALMNTLERDTYKKEYHDFNIVDGIIEIDSCRNLKDIDKLLSEYDFFLPYYPIIFSGKPLLFLVENNIPNLYSYIFELKDIIVGMKFEYNNKNIIIGKKTLKNVAGFSLKLLSHYNILGKPKNIFFKIYPKSLKNLQYTIICFNINSADKLDEIIETIKTKILTPIIYKSEQGYNVNVILYNHQPNIDEVKRTLDNMNICYVQMKDFKKLALENSGDSVLIVGLTETPKIKLLNISMKTREDYLLINRTLIIPLKKNEYNKLSQRLLNSPLSSIIEAIRYVNENEGSVYLFLTNRLSRQMTITKNLVNYINKYISSYGNEGIFLSSTSETIPPIKFLKLSHYLPEYFKEEVKKCTRCGLCMSECPLYNEKKDDFFSPRGFILSLAEFNTKSKNYFREFVNYCITICNVKNPPCENNCPTGVSFSNIFAKFNTLCSSDDE